MPQQDVPTLSLMASKAELELVLESQSPEDCTSVAVRSAWRVMPILGQIRDDELFRDYVFEAFKMTLLVQFNCSDSDAANHSLIDAGLRRIENIGARWAMAGSHTALATLLNYAPVQNAALTLERASRSGREYTGTREAGLDVWSNTGRDCEHLLARSKIPLLSARLWLPDGNQPEWSDTATSRFLSRLRSFDEPFPLLAEWYEQVQIDATIDPFPAPLLIEIANEDAAFWGDRPDNPRTPDIIIADIAERLGWKPEPQKIEDSPYDPAFIGYDPIQLNREGPQPIVVRDHNYLHSAALKRLENLESTCASDQGGGQAVKVLTDLLPGIRAHLGSTPDNFYLKGIVTEHRSLLRQIDTQSQIEDMSEAEQEWQAPLWPVHTRNEAIDLGEVVKDLIDNDEQAQILASAPEDEPISADDRQVKEDARSLTRELNNDVEQGYVDESVPRTLDRAVVNADEADQLTPEGEAPGGRPFSHIRGTMQNFGNSVARAAEAELERVAQDSSGDGQSSESWRSKLFWGTAGSLVAMGIANSAGFFSWALGVLQSIQKALRGKQWQDLIDLLKSIVNASGL